MATARIRWLVGGADSNRRSPGPKPAARACRTQLVFKRAGPGVRKPLGSSGPPATDAGATGFGRITFPAERPFQGQSTTHGHVGNKQQLRSSVGRLSVPTSLSVAAVAVVGLMIAACSTSSDVQAPVSTTSPATAESPSTGPVVTDAELVAVAKRVMPPSGTLCDTHRDTAPSDVNACPYTDRLKARVNALYRQAWSGQANPNPVLSSGPPCDSSSPTVVSYFAKPSSV